MRKLNNDNSQCFSGQGNWVTCSGGTGTTKLSEMTDFAVIKKDADEWTLNQNCTTSIPCNIRSGLTNYQFTSAADVIVTGTSSTGTLFWCFDLTDGKIYLHHNGGDHHRLRIP